MNTQKTLVAFLAAATTLSALSMPAFARRGADDPAGHVRQARGADDASGHVRGGHGADDTTPHK